MLREIIMQKFDENMGEGTIVEWCKKGGDQIDKGDILAIIVTEKSTYDLESEFSGKLAKIFIAEHGTVPVGQIIALIGETDADLQEYSEKEIAVTEEIHSRNAIDRASDGNKMIKIRATPAAKEQALEHNIDLECIGVQGRLITEKDVLKYINEQKR